MSTKITRVGHHLQRTSRLRVGFRPASTKDGLGNLVYAACRAWEIRNGFVRDVLKNLHGRKGVGDELDAIEEDIYISMREELVLVVLKSLP